MIIIFQVYYMYFSIFSNDIARSIAFFSDLLAPVTVAGVIFAFYQYFKNRKQARKQVLLTLRSQLEAISEWASYSNDGYLQREKEERSKRATPSWCNPFSVIFKTETTAIANIWSLQGITLLPNDIVEKIAPLNQSVESFNSYLDSIKAFARSIDVKTAISIDKKLKKGLGPFTDSMEFEELENDICVRLFDMYVYLHFTLIGDESSDTFYKKHKDLLDLVRKHLND